MNYTVEVSNKVDENEWNNRLLENRSSTVYQSANWGQIYKAFHSIPIFITIRNNNRRIDGQLLALIHEDFIWDDLNFFARTIGKKLKLQKTLTWFYGPIIHDENCVDEITLEILHALEETCIKNKITLVKGSSHPFSKQSSEEIFTKFGYKLEPWATYIIDLHQTIEGLYESLDKKTKYDIRKSEKNQLEFIIANDRKSLNELIKLKTNEKAMVGKKFPVSLHFYDNHFNYLQKEGYEKLFLAKHEGETISGILNVIFNGNVLQHGVSAPSNRELLGGPFLTWHTIKWCIENKYLTYDMGGINPHPENEKEESMNFYKSKWGGKRCDYVRYTKIVDSTKLKISSIIKDPKKIKKILKRRK